MDELKQIEIFELKNSWIVASLDLDYIEAFVKLYLVHPTSFSSCKTD
jgi:hypothetical protein